MLQIYRASAGSGKTFRLTGDYIRLLFGAEKLNQHRKILAVTFTNKATEEMKSRILLELNKMANGDDSKFRNEIMKEFNLAEEQVNRKAGKMLLNILHDYSAFSISTIDSFFQQIIRAFARDIGIHGGYELELHTDQVLDQAVDNLFSDLAEKENKLLLDWLTGFAEEKIEKSESWNLQGSIRSLGFEIFKESYQHKAEITNQKLHNREFLLEYKKELSAIEAEFANRVKKISVEALGIIESNGLETTDFKGGQKSAMNKLYQLKDGIFKLTDTFFKMAIDVQDCYTKSASKATITAIETSYFNGLQQKLQEIATIFEVDIIQYNTVKIIRKHLNTLGILSDLAMQIKKLTSDRQIMLISDSNLLLNKIIDNSETPFIYEKTGVQIDHFMIDEFQDTSVLQWKNFMPLIKNSLAAGNFNLLVGDVKQSIYRWRNSDWKLLDNQVYTDFNPEEIHSEVLGTNWRSDRNIIGFNNVFFRDASIILQQKLNETLETVSLTETSDLQNKIIGAYRDIAQDVSEKASDGCVKFNFINQENQEEKWKEISLNKLPSMLEDLQLRGYRPCDIAILVRENDDEVQIINKLLHYKNSAEANKQLSYNIMSTKGLLLGSSSSVRFLLSLLHLLVNPDDELNKTIVSYEFARGKLKLSAEEAVRAAINDAKESSKLSPLFSDEENELLLSYRHFPLFEMTEKIIGSFDLCSWYHEIVFIQAFQDLIFKFSTGKSSDLNSFIHWWNISGNKESIATPEDESAFRIMTIHKSKGLDFPVVIIPFCDWELDSRKRNILWCETDELPFGKIPLIPVEYSSVLAKSVFAESYYREMMQTYIDNINVAYVAFTRPEHELIVVCPKPKPDKSGNYTIKTLAGLLYHTFTNADEDVLMHYNAENDTFTLGEPTHHIKIENPSRQADNFLSEYPVIDISDRLRIRHKYHSIFSDKNDISSNPLEYGILMHEILCNIKTTDDIDVITTDFVRQGRISEIEAEKIQMEIRDFCQKPIVEPWFRKGLHVLNETPVLTPEGHEYRPDRIVIDGKNAIIIDYKFGENEMPKYESQVKNYSSLLDKMGYNSQSYLCYVKLNKIVEVN
jgi:ATP-dependent exoDNAse (exonuclease V) beta subunit